LTNARTKRLFFALWPDASIRHNMAKRSLELPPHDGRRIHPQDLHITLAFLGPVGVEGLPCVLEAGDRIRGEPFTLDLDLLSFWPKPRVVWIGTEKTPPALARLVETLSEVLTECGFEPETRPYVPHVTLARKVSAFASDLPLEPIPWAVREFALVESLPAELPPHYAVLKKWTLGS